MSGKYVHKLKKPVKAHGQELTELTLAEPTTKMVMEFGYPYLVIAGEGGSGLQLQPKVAASYITQLAQVPRSTVEALPIADLQALQAWLLGFFGEGEAETPQSES